MPSKIVNSGSNILVVTVCPGKARASASTSPNTRISRPGWAMISLARMSRAAGPPVPSMPRSMLEPQPLENGLRDRGYDEHDRPPELAHIEHIGAARSLIGAQYRGGHFARLRRQHGRQLHAGSHTCAHESRL